MFFIMMYFCMFFIMFFIMMFFLNMIYHIIHRHVFWHSMACSTSIILTFISVTPIFTMTHWEFKTSCTSVFTIHFHPINFNFTSLFTIFFLFMVVIMMFLMILITNTFITLNPITRIHTIFWIICTIYCSRTLTRHTIMLTRIMVLFVVIGVPRRVRVVIVMNFVDIMMTFFTLTHITRHTFSWILNTKLFTIYYTTRHTNSLTRIVVVVIMGLFVVIMMTFSFHFSLSMIYHIIHRHVFWQSMACSTSINST